MNQRRNGIGYMTLEPIISNSPIAKKQLVLISRHISQSTGEVGKTVRITKRKVLSKTIQGPQMLDKKAWRFGAKVAIMTPLKNSSASATVVSPTWNKTAPNNTTTKLIFL